MLDEDQFKTLNDGIELFNQGEFFEAHEFFEELWQAANEENERAEFLFLVRLAAAGVHLTNENFSALFLFMLAKKQLDADLTLQFIDSDNNLLAGKIDALIDKLEQAARAELTTIAKNTGLQLSLSKTLNF